MAAASQSTSRTDFVFMLVALYFILISFFIILSTLSVKDNEKLQSAVSSVSRTFKVNDHIINPTKKEDITSYSVFLGDLQGWIDNLYTIGNVNITRKGNQIAITIKHPRFFKYNSSEFNADAQKALESLAQLLITWQNEYLTELEIVASEPVDHSHDDQQDMIMGASHAGAIAAYLTLHGIAPQALSVTMRDNSEEVMAFTFIIRIPPKLQ